jgi:polar amino acid transport system substrate-binding protein
MLNWRSALALPLAMTCVTALAACGGSSSSSTTSSSTPAATSTSSSATPTPAADPAVVKLVPSSIKSKGTMTVAADASYAPNEFIGPDGHTVIGMDADLSHALAAVMGLKANVVNVTFDAIIPGLAATKYDMGASSFSDTKMREKVVNFVDYFLAGESFITKSSGGTSISSLSDLCGKSVAVESTTTEQMDAQTQSKKCTAGGKPAVKILVFPNQNAANLALLSGRAQLGFLDSPPASYQVKVTHGQLKVVGPTVATGPYGLALPKTNALDQAVLASLKVLMKDGTYAAILKKWSLSSGAIPAAQVKINGATS